MKIAFLILLKKKYIIFNYFNLESMATPAASSKAAVVKQARCTVCEISRDLQWRKHVVFALLLAWRLYAAAQSS
jgi:hypothetical protein